MERISDTKNQILDSTKIPAYDVIIPGEFEEEQVEIDDYPPFEVEMKKPTQIAGENDEPLDPNFETMLEAKKKYLRSGLEYIIKQVNDEEEEGEDRECNDPCVCGSPRRYTLPPSPIPSDHTFDNLNEIRRNFCRQVFPKNLGYPISEDILLEVLIQTPSGDYEMILPGNQIYPGFLSNRITDDGVPTVVNVLLEVRGITRVNLCYNEITDKGIALLAPALQECGNIVDIDLMHNNLTATGILTLVKALMHRGPLRSLRLTGMKIGEEGLRALTCLILSGRAPIDLDIGDCDISIPGFQALCSALHAIEIDVDYPDFLLLKNNLPVDLVVLKNMKSDYNDEVAHTTRLMRKSSLPEFVRVNGDPIAERLLPGQSGDGDTEHVTPEVFESFSATILQGLFDLRHRFSEDDLEKQELEVLSLEIDPAASGELMLLPEVDQIVDTFHKIRDGEEVGDEDADSDSIFLSRSLYCLDVNAEEVSLLDPIADYSDVDSSNNSSFDTSEKTLMPSDTYTAQAAATFVIKEAMQTASKNTASSSCNDSTDITQLLLMTVLDTIEKVSQGTNLTDEDCHRILEDAMEKTCEFIFPMIPTECQVDKEDIRCFFKVLLSACQGTFKQLLENPFITQALLEHGTIACREKEQHKERKRLKSRGGAMSESQIRHIAASFIRGIVKEAAQMVGVSSPFGIKDDIGSDLVSTELKIEGTVDSLFDTAGTLASAVEKSANKTEDCNAEYIQATDNFVFDLFENVHKLVCETEMTKKIDETKPTAGPEIYKHVSRPTRLVLNRPIFGSNAPIMAAKLGDYLAVNTSLKALYLQKWELAEEGMLALMEILVARNNTTLVLLDLSCNNLGADGIKLLAIYMTRNKNLKHLILNHNGIRNPGLEHLNKHLLDSALVSLDIAHNGITDQQLNPLLAALPMSQIRALFIWGNKFGRETWTLMKSLYDQGILNTGTTDVILQQADQDRMIVKNMQIRDINEYYEVPAVNDYGLRLPPSYIDDSHRKRSLSSAT